MMLEIVPPGFFTHTHRFDDVVVFDRLAHVDDKSVGVDLGFIQMEQPFDEDGEAQHGASSDDNQDDVPVRSAIKEASESSKM